MDKRNAKRPVYLVDRSLTGVGALEQLGQVYGYNESPLECRGLCEPDALLIRSVTSIGDRELDAFPSLETVATATAGRDHIDEMACNERGVRVVSAPGHNAEAVADWVWTALLTLAVETQGTLSGMSMGIVGAGNTGQAVARRASAHGVRVLFYDPPREEAEASFSTASWEEVLGCHILTFHVPLTRGESWPTEGMYRPGVEALGPWVINASRGEVLDLEESQGLFWPRTALDVFPSEPHISPHFPREAVLATPHVGGNTFEAKREATRVIAEQVHGLHGTGPFLWEDETDSPRGEREAMVWVEAGWSLERKLLEVVGTLTQLTALSSAFKERIEASPLDEVGAVFRAIRGGSRRRALCGRRVYLEVEEAEEWRIRLEAHGVRCVGTREEAEVRIRERPSGILKRESLPG